MVRSNHPLYRRGGSKCHQLRISLTLLERYQRGEQLDSREEALARLMERHLTPREVEYLTCYYQQGMTHRQIARLLRRSSSAVSKGIVRAERKFWDFAEIME